MTLAELDCILHFVAAQGRPIPVPTRLSYHSDDPYAVHIAFHMADQDPVSWVFARDLLAAGTARPSGHGDVRIRPGVAEQSESLLLELSPHRRRALFTMPAAVVKPWIEQTYRLVPAGFEGASLDLDSEVSRLLGEVA